MMSVESIYNFCCPARQIIAKTFSTVFVKAVGQTISFKLIKGVSPET